MGSNYAGNPASPMEFTHESSYQRAIPVVASMQNVNEVSALVDSGTIYWYEIEERDLETE